MSGNNGAAPVVAFIGTTPNIGTTSAAFATAYRLAELGGIEVGYLCLNLKSAKLHRFLGEDEPDVTLDRLQPELRSASLTPDMLRSADCTVRGRANLHVLFGNLNREGAEFVGAEEIDHLLDVAEKTYGFVVLDVGAYWDNAATICSIRRADSRVLVTTPALSHFQEDGRRWVGSVSPLFQVQPNQYDCIIVHYPWRKGGYRMNDICKELGTAPMGEFKMNDSMFASLDKGGYDEWLREDPAGRTAMRKPAARLLVRHGVQGSFSSMVRQPWYRRLNVHRNGVGSS
ncbi:hypothetical protein [Paenibacillus sp. 1011MAR3C5]|uniref:hypothetical protein n=1 Tax=Paenibacillus sp. 1011MAR3C5 TaxID=1675787 RepID=UPI002175BEEC|nr:hypothetical protein [Paenibacillus sp. 1011MAR3C5]